MSTLYGNLAKKATEAELLAATADFYKRTTSCGSSKHRRSVRPPVRGTNYCNLVVSVDSAPERLRIVSYIDNLGQGPGRSALQNMKLIFGLPETTDWIVPAMFP